MNATTSEPDNGSQPRQAPPVGDYALISDCHAAALVSRGGSIDWCCMPRFDSEPCFGRLLDWQGAGHCSIASTNAGVRISRQYLDDTMVLSTRFDTATGSAQVFDLLVLKETGRTFSGRQLLRIVEGLEGNVDFHVEVQPRFDFGDVRPWLREDQPGVFVAVGGAHGLVICGDMGLEREGKYSLSSDFRVGSGQRRRLSVQFSHPELLDNGPDQVPDAQQLDQSLEQTGYWWRHWCRRINIDDTGSFPGIRRSVITLKALSYLPTGAIIAAPSTSLPEGLSGTRNWDYRFSWVRDAAFTARALVEVGCEDDAYQFRRFIERSSAGSAAQFRTLYGVDGGRRQEEFELVHLEGYRGASPVRVGNRAARQIQLDVFGETLELSWLWHRRGYAPSQSYWQFLVNLLNRVCAHWQEPDHSIWEVRGARRHFVHSKVMCWSALNRGIHIAEELGREAPVEQWQRSCEDIRAAVEEHGYDRERGIFVQSFEEPYLDAALLRMSCVDFIDHQDERMLRTTDAIRAALEVDGLLHRYDAPDGLPGQEGAFLPCSFWLAECLAFQQRRSEARSVFERAVRTANDLGLFSEEYDTRRQLLWGNFPQALTHLSYITAALALQRLRAIDNGHEADEVFRTASVTSGTRRPYHE
ncbi:MAG: glycoside hydrolase family 15 protein [Thiogranum sp.]|nr:glycoside hydrolase family 15 protein [Thiogranum sp.]